MLLSAKLFILLISVCRSLSKLWLLLLSLTSWWPSLVVHIPVLVVQIPVLVVLLVVGLHALVWPQNPWWRVQLLLRVVDPLTGERTEF